MRKHSLLLENPTLRRRRAVGLTLTTLALVAALLLCALPLHRHDHPNHLEASPFVIDAEAGLLDHLHHVRDFSPPEPLEAKETVPGDQVATMAAEILTNMIDITDRAEDPLEPEPTFGSPEVVVADIFSLQVAEPVVADSVEQKPGQDSPSALTTNLGPCEAKAQAILARRAAPLNFHNGSIQSGQSASVLLAEYLNPAQIFSMAQACKDAFNLRHLKAGQPYTLACRCGEFERLEYEIDSEERLVVTRQGDVFEATTEPIEYQVTMRRIEGIVESSLFEAVTDTGEGPELAMKLADIFGWEVDFIRDLRQGDSFKALVEKRFRDGKFSGYGKVLAAEFVNQGHAFQGYLYEEEEGRRAYYDADGKNLKRAFLKAPLSFTRISSNFSWSRKHPVLGINRPHPAIDYAAPTGTPVMTVGDGRIVKKGWDKGGGNFVIVRHGNGYETTYMHLSRFAKGLNKGDWVNQSQVIAYVGTTGLSTGPHLDFRMKRYDKYVNPRQIENPRAGSLSEEHLDSFQLLVEERGNLLESMLAVAPNPADSSENDAENL